MDQQRRDGDSGVGKDRGCDRIGAQVLIAVVLEVVAQVDRACTQARDLEWDV